MSLSISLSEALSLLDACANVVLKKPEGFIDKWKARYPSMDFIKVDGGHKFQGSIISQISSEGEEKLTDVRVIVKLDERTLFEEYYGLYSYRDLEGEVIDQYVDPNNLAIVRSFIVRKLAQVGPNLRTERDREKAAEDAKKAAEDAQVLAILRKMKS